MKRAGMGKKILMHCAAALLLALVYAGTFVFDPRLIEEKRSNHSWISRDLLDRADWIEISGMSGPVILKRANGVWVMPLFLGEGSPDPFRDFPVKQQRVEGLFGALSRRARYPARSRGADPSNLERLGLVEGRASRIVILGGGGLPLLDLFVGFGGSAGGAIYFRKAGSSETRSGEDIFSLYTETGRTAWFDLSLFGNGRPGPSVSLESVQRAVVYPPDGNGSWSVIRSGSGWIFSGSSAGSGDSRNIPADKAKTESWVRAVINAEADDFDYFMSGGAAPFSAGSVILELGDGASKIIRFGPEDENKNRPAAVSGSEFVYILGERTLGRLLPDEGALF